MLRVGYVLAAMLAMVVPARAESDWFQIIFNGLKKSPADAAGAVAARPHKIVLNRPADLRPFGEKVDGTNNPARKNPLFAKPDLPPGKGIWQWRILKTAWTDEDHAGFEAFVRAIGDSDCKTVHECMTSPVANPRYHATNPSYMQFRADCADLPSFLRGYYSWKSGLAFSFSTRYGSHPRAAGNQSSVTGNTITERYDVIGPGPDARRAIPAIGQFVSTEHFRIPPAYVGPQLPDHYPVRLTRESIRPGTVIFDPDGHVAVVFKVTENGLIHYIDAHPDNSLTRGIYGRDFARTLPEMGAGFKRWRPQELIGASRAADGTLVGGRIVLTPDRDLADWSDEQFYGTSLPRPKLWSDGKFEINGIEAEYYDYLRVRLAGPGFKYDPIDETRTRIRSLCDDLKERVDAVNLAIRAGYPTRQQPPRLPQNIYATKGDWEIYSTPSRDARLKTSFEELRDEIARFIEMSAANSKLLNYAGTDLRADLREVYRNESSACSISYVKTDGSTQVLTYVDIVRRLFDMSFDPYHCVERRWGATSPEELKSCPDGEDKRAWYQAEDRLRNQLTRTYGEPMGWTLAQLQNRQADIGIEEVSDVDVEKVLDGVVVAGSAADKSTSTAAARNRRGQVAGRQVPARLVVPARHRQ